MTYIFVSYARIDLQKVEQIMEELHKIGFDYWMDKRNLQGGQWWPQEITDAIIKCQKFLLFMSSASMASNNVLQEVQIAFENKKEKILLRLEEVEIPASFQYQLAGIQWIEHSKPDWKLKLVHALGSTLSPSTEPTLPFPVAHQKSTRSKPSDSSPPIPKTYSSDQHKRIPKNEVCTQKISAGLRKILQITERMYYNGDLTLEQEKSLTKILKSVAMKKRKLGEKTMSSIKQEYSGDSFLQASRTLAYYLLTLSDYHGRWPELNLSNQTKNQSLSLLRSLQDEVLTTDALVQQVITQVEKQKISFETKKIINSLRFLRLQLAKIDAYLYLEEIPYEVSNELERHFDDLVYSLNKYILILESFAKIASGSKYIQ